MKKIFIAIMALGGMMAAVSCGNSKLNEEQEKNYRLEDSLQTALNNADSMFSILYDVTTGLEQISQLEHLLNGKVNPEDAPARQSIEEQMAVIQQGLIDRRKRIEELEAKLAASNGTSGKLKAQIAQLREQIDQQAATVADLTQQLEAANFKITTLNATVSDLQVTVDTISAAKQQVESERNEAIEALNTVYYVIGNKKELKEHNFLSGGGFLSKSKVLEGDFDKNYMTRADKRTLTAIPLDVKKATLLTKQPEGSYSLERGANGMLTLLITNPDKFWSKSNLLVIEAK